MHQRFVRPMSFCAIALLTVFLCGPAASAGRAAPAAAPAATAGVKVGTFHRGNLIMKFYRSAHWEATMTGLMEQRNKAATASDLATVEKIEAQIREMQQLAERQLAGKAPITNILEQLKPQWAEIARETGVQLIVEDTLYLAPNTPLVDITMALLNRFPPKARAAKS